MAGKIWIVNQVGLPNPFYLIECILAQRIRRRVMLMIDKSDSTIRTSGALQSIAVGLSRTLDLGDSVTIWIMGEATPQQEIEIIGDDSRREIVQCIRSLKDFGCGSWLRETWDGMRAYAGNPARGVHDFFLAITDGEIFDAGADLAPLNGPLFWFALEGDATRATEDFTRNAVALPATPSGLQKTLACSQASALLSVRCTDALRACAFDEHGRLQNEFPPDELTGLAVPRLLLVGGHLESVRVDYQAGPSSWSDEVFETVVVEWPEEAHLQAVLRALSHGAIRWNLDRLKALAGGHAQAFECSHDHAISRLGDLFCNRCRGFLLSLDFITPEQISVLRWKFLLHDDDTVGEAAEVSEKEETGDRPWAVKTDTKGRWLILDLGRA